MGGVGRIPAALVAGGEGQGAREKEWAMAHLLVCLRARKGGWRGLIGGEQGAATEVNDDGGAPTRETTRMRAG